MRRDLSIVMALAAAAAGLGACANDDPGLLVSVDLTGFVPATRTLKVAISASDGGFKMMQIPINVDGIGVSTEDVDGDSNLELMLEFLNPGASISFRVATANQVDQTVRGQALAFDAAKLIAGADQDPAGATLPAGGRGSLALKLTAREDEHLVPTTRTTDLLTVPADVTVKTTMVAHFSSVAVCDVDGDRKGDLVLGAPQAKSGNLNGVGAVYVLLGTGGLGAAIDPFNGNTVMEFHFSGKDPGDQLGAAVACTDLTGDGVDDLIVSAPGAALGAGQVYAVFGHSQIRNQAIVPGTAGADAPDVTWQTATDTEFGRILFAADLNGDAKTELLVASAERVHLLKNVTQRASSAISVDGPDHVTFANVKATSVTAGDLRQAGGVDVVIGDSAAARPGTTMGGGAIFAFANVDLAGTMQYDAPSAPMVMYGNRDMLFGAAVLALTTTSRPGQDLIVGAPGFQNGQGAFYVYQSDNAFFGTAIRDFEMDATKRIDGPLPGGRFGAALAGTPTGSAPNFKWDLLVGAPATRHHDTRPLAGAAYLFGGGDGWLFPLYEQLFGAASTDGLGTVVAGGQVNADLVGDLVTVAPNAMPDGADPGVVYVRFNHVTR